jgi:LacI family transcriptional regulator
MRARQKRVLVVLGWYDYRLHRGIEKYAQEHGWHLSGSLAREKEIPWGWTGDGILALLGAGDDLAKFVQRAGRPTVDFSFRRPQLKFHRVLGDNFHVAQLVAEHFLSRGLRHFVFYSDVENWCYAERGAGFEKVLREAGHECRMLLWHRSPEYRAGREQWLRKQKWLIKQIKQLPQPLAIFAATDEQALDVLEACEVAGLGVPEQIAIAGAGNNLLAPDAMHTPVTSVDINLELVGYRGAELLDGLMTGKKIPLTPVRVPASGLLVRKSSDLLAVNHRGVANALRYIWEHAHEPIQVKDLTGAAAMSNRGLHKAFLKILQRTPGDELQRIRIERAKRLLAEPGHKIETLAGMCGYQSANSFGLAFKHVTGSSPRQYRDKLASG